MSEKLLPCPFCGAPVHHDLYGMNSCSSTDCNLYWMRPMTDEQWNARPTPSTLLDREKVIKWITANSKLANQGPEIVRVVQIAPLLEAINSGNLGAEGE